MSLLYEFIHDKLIKHTADHNIISRKDFKKIISYYFRGFPKEFKNKLINELIDQDYIIRINQRELKIINHTYSNNIREYMQHYCKNENFIAMDQTSLFWMDKKED